MSQGNSRINHCKTRSLALVLALLLPGLVLVFGTSSPAYLAGHTEPAQDAPSMFRIGEKLSYNVSFGKFSNAAYAETFVASRGKLSGRDAVEIRGRVKTLEMVSAAFFMVDETRSVYVAPDSGLPLYMTSNSKDSILPQEKIRNYLTVPASGYDLLSVIYKARESLGAGTFPLMENDQISSVTFIPTNSERVKTDAGEFDTTISMVQSPAIAEMGIHDLRINFTTDEARIPLLIRFKTDKGNFRAIVTAIALPTSPTASDSPIPTPTPTPVPASTARPTPSPELYVDNRPLLPDLGFQIGEVLEYGVSSGGRPLARLTFNVQERRQFQNTDSLLLTATVTHVEPGTDNFVLGESAKVQVDPETISPKWAAMNFTSVLPGLKQTVTYDRKTGIIKFGSPEGVDAPIGTHNPLSLFYAMRSFNLRLSKNRDNPVNDTRVAVFWEEKPYIFTLRPSNPAEITIGEEKVFAQLITINTTHPQLDRLGLKVWLRASDRVPVRMTAGRLQADLISRSSRIP